MSYAIALIGNPNSGKTTLFNALTGGNQYVGNWPGVTVERKEAMFQIGEGEALLVDLPGVYSLRPYSLEERIAGEFLSEDKPDVIVNVVDATCLSRSLFLTTQLMEAGAPIVIALNFMDEVRASGAIIDAPALSRALGVPIAPVSAKRREGFDALFALIDAARGTKPANPLAAGDEAERYAAIDAALARAEVKYAQGTGEARLDDVFLNRWAALPLFAAMLGLAFFATFGPLGNVLRDCAAGLVAGAGAMAERGLTALASPPWTRSLILDGIFPGVGGVMEFMPQILMLMLLMQLMEDSGYMARAAFLSDGLLRAFGLSGRSFIPMLMGLGCTTTAVVGARGVENDRDRRMTVMLTPFVSCGAKLPVYGLFASAFFPGREAIVVGLLYLGGMMLMALCALLLRKTAFRTGETPFIMELPTYRLPSPSAVARRLGQRAKDFLARAGTIIFAMSVLVWLLDSVGALRVLGGALASIFAPLGFGSWQAGAALASGLAAKEAVVSTLSAALGDSPLQALFSARSACAYMTFILVYPPCVSAMAAMRRELGDGRLLASMIAIQLALAYIAAFLVYQLGGVL